MLNYKRIPYKTVWVSFPDIEPTLVKLGYAPTATKLNDLSKPPYTLPAIVDASSTPPVVIADSLAIAEYLDEKYPDRPVLPKPGKALQYVFEQWFVSLRSAELSQIMLPAIATILDDRGKVYYQETREKRLGKKLEELSPKGEARDGHWKVVQSAFGRIAAVIEQNGPGVDYIAGGSEPTRADFIYISLLICIRAMMPDEWENRVKHWNGGRWEKMLKMTEEWQTVN